VTEFTATDRYEDFTTAVNALNGALGLAAPGTSRILFIVSDGRYQGTRHAGGQKLIPGSLNQAARSSGSPPATPPPP
jgi:hypothetical protein